MQEDNGNETDGAYAWLGKRPPGPRPAGAPRARSDQKAQREHGDQADAREQHHHFAQVQRYKWIMYPHGRPPLTGLPLRIPFFLADQSEI